MNFEQFLAISFTIGAIVFNFAASIRAFTVAIHCDTDCGWMCKTTNKHTGITVLLGFAMICFILGTLKSWSIGDIFIGYWQMMPETYHWRAFIYLTENYGVAILCWRVTTLIKHLGICEGRG